MTFIAHPRTCLRFARRLAPAVLSVSLVACGSSGGGGPSTNGATMTDTNNYKATSAMTIPTIQTASKSDLTLDWSGIQKDLLCHTKQPIVNVTFAIFKNKTPASLESELSVGIFNTAEVSKYFFLGTDMNTTTSMLTALKATNTHVDPATDYVESASTLYLLIFANSQTPGVGAESMVFLQPSDSAPSSDTTVMAPDACASNILSFSAMLGSGLDVPNTAPYTVDWSKLTKDGFGNTIDFTTIQKLEVGYYQGKTASDLMAHFLDVEQDATTLYKADVPSNQKSIDLATAKTDGGDAFTGFTKTDGVYAMALLCKNCSVPAPIAFAVLQPK